MYIQHLGPHLCLVMTAAKKSFVMTLRPQEVHIGTSYGYKTKCVATRGREDDPGSWGGESTVFLIMVFERSSR